MRLYAKSDLNVRFTKSNLSDYQIKKGEHILTELSYKFTRDTIQQELRQAGLDFVDWCTDERSLVGVAIARRTN